MTEKELIKLEFKRNDVTAEESGDNAYHYYTYDLSKSNYQIALITDSNDNIINDNWNVTFFETSDILFNDYNDVKELIEIFNRSIKKNKNI